MDARVKQAEVTRVDPSQLYLLICGTTNLTMHLIYRATVPDVWDPLFERLILASVFYVSLLVTLLVEPRRRASLGASLMVFASICEALWLARGLYQNHLKMEFTLGAHTAFYVFFFFQSSKRGLYLYTVIGLTAFTWATYATSHPAMSPTLATGLISAAPLFAWAVHGKIVTEKRLIQLQAELAALAFKDPLTGIYNRRALMEEFSREISRAQRSQSSFAVILLDLDHFKRTNDTYGHSGGDRLLQRVGRTLSSKIRGQDFVCRYGGEEFVILLSQVELNQVSELAERLLKSIRQLEISHEGRTIKSTASAGVSFFPDDGPTVEALLGRADEALYRAKGDGRDRLELSESMKAVLEPQAATAALLRPA